MATATAIRTQNSATQLRLKMFSQPRCPDCAGPLVFGEGCQTCPICGFSHCS